MAETMIERVARTLHELTLKNGGASRGASDMMADARAIVSAMREPTDTMIDAAYRKEGIGPDATDVPFALIPDDSWSAMIDAALKD